MGKRKNEAKADKLNKKLKTNEKEIENDDIEEEDNNDQEEEVNTSLTNSTKKDKKNKKDKKKKEGKGDTEDITPVTPITPSKDTPKSEKKKSKKSTESTPTIPSINEELKIKKDKKKKTMEVENKDDNVNKNDDGEDDGFVIRKPDNITVGFGNKLKISSGNSNANVEPTNRLFVSGIPYSYKEDKMKEVFGKYGEVTDVYLPIFQDSGKPKGFGFVSFTTNEEAASACELNGQQLEGKQIKVELSSQKPRERNNNFNNNRSGGGGGGGGYGGKGGNFGGNRGGDRNSAPRNKNTGPLGPNPPEGSTTLFVGNLSYKIQDEDVYNFFTGCDISQIRYCEDKATGKFKGSAFVEFSSKDDVVKAGQLNGKSLLERDIYLDYAAPRR